jgi:hypothetical protein
VEEFERPQVGEFEVTIRDKSHAWGLYPVVTGNHLHSRGDFRAPALMTQTHKKDVKRFRANLRTEMDGAAIYDELAAAESNSADGTSSSNWLW